MAPSSEDVRRETRLAPGEIVADVPLLRGLVAERLTTWLEAH
jgi:hypothetical protein